MSKYLQEELKRKGMAHYIPQMEKIMAIRNGETIKETTYCQCWSEISSLNKESAPFILMNVELINPSDESDGYIKISNYEHKTMETIRIRFCPLCGRKL